MIQVGTLEIGSVREEELDAMLRVMCESFAMPFEAAWDIFRADPYFDLDNKQVLRVDGRIVSCLTIIDTVCQIGKAPIRLAGIAGVSTHPQERRRGFAGHLLTETLRTLDARGFALSALFPFDYAYYRRFGYDQASMAFRMVTTPRRLLPSREAQHIRPACHEDIPRLSTLYNSRLDTFHCLRDARRWRYLLDFVKERLVYIGPTGVEGWLFCDRHQHSPQAASEHREESEAPESGPNLLRVLELHAETAAARRGLIGYLAAQADGVDVIEFASSLNGLAASGLLHTLDSEREPMAHISIEVVPSAMARVISLPRLVETLCTAWSQANLGCLLAEEIGSEGMGLVLHDALLRPEGEALVLEGEGDEVRTRCVTVEAARERALHLSGDVRAWSQVVTGHRGADDAVALGRLAPSSPQAVEIAAHLFPRRDPFLPAPDHF